MARSFYSYKIDLLIKWGFLRDEAKVYADQYTTYQIRTLPYFRRLTSWRRLYVSNFKKRGFTNKEIRDKIKDLYTRRGWIKKGKIDPWEMLRHFRQTSIDEHEYIPTKRKGSHHKTKGISKVDILKQKKRGTEARYQVEMAILERQWRKAVDNNDQSEKRRLERGMDATRRKYGK